MDIKEMQIELEAVVHRELNGGGPLNEMLDRVHRAINEAFDLSEYNAYARRRLGSTPGHRYEPDEISKAEADGFDLGKLSVSAMYQPPAWAWTPQLKPTDQPKPPPKVVEPVIPADRYDEVAPLLGLEPPGTKLERALAFINAKRRGVQKPLDPKEAGWTDDDVFKEAKRLGWKG